MNILIHRKKLSAIDIEKLNLVIIDIRKCMHAIYHWPNLQKNCNFPHFSVFWMLKYSIGWRPQIAKFNGSLILKAKGHLAARNRCRQAQIRQKKNAPGDDEPLSNSNCLERLREFQLKMYRGWGGGPFALCINNPKKSQPTPWYTINKTGARKIDRGAISQLKKQADHY